MEIYPILDSIGSLDSILKSELRDLYTTQEWGRDISYLRAKLYNTYDTYVQNLNKTDETK